MPAPVKYGLQEAKCDVEGCGAIAALSTDGTEVDADGRKAIPHLNVCAHHENWPHSEDAAQFADGVSASGRNIKNAPDAYHLRAAHAAKMGA